MSGVVGPPSFFEVKLVQLEVIIIPEYQDEVKNASQNALAIGGAQNNLVTPTTYQNVIDNGDSQSYSFLTDTSGKGRYHAIKPRAVQYASISTPNPGNSLGCPGCIQLYSSGLPNSTHMFNIQVTGFYCFRSRT